MKANEPAVAATNLHDLRPFDVGDFVTFVVFANVAATVLITDLGATIGVRYSDGTVDTVEAIHTWRPATAEEIAHWREDSCPQLKTLVDWSPTIADPGLGRAQRRARRQVDALTLARHQLYLDDAAGEDDELVQQTPVPVEDSIAVTRALLDVAEELPDVVAGLRATITPGGEVVPIAAANTAHLIAEQLVAHLNTTWTELRGHTTPE
jgi:hypothetical protein